MWSCLRSYGAALAIDAVSWREVRPETDLFSPHSNTNASSSQCSSPLSPIMRLVSAGPWALGNTHSSFTRRPAKRDGKIARCATTAMEQGTMHDIGVVIRAHRPFTGWLSPNGRSGNASRAASTVGTTSGIGRLPLSVRVFARDRDAAGRMRTTRCPVRCSWRARPGLSDGDIDCEPDRFPCETAATLE
ncbi:hypothetical protein BD311DRAFT_504979 [Dichomitus squalens]|uniref:Uncharacterized protein n=1 Tax=Dichomitus squalens TaxID=114155 RepID=A0A4Q9MEZ2_9APHY|nr:hypothetical protein BD311DRAFT_504979 [Dichomitus squalens]